MACSLFALRQTLVTTLVGVFAVIAAPEARAQQFQDQTAARFPADPNEYTNSVTIGDIDGDGDLDLIWANGGGFSSATTPQILRIYINNGTGTFTDETVARTGGLTFRARGVELGDVERDGDLDIIVANDFVAAPALLINNGAGVFTDQSAARLPTTTLTSMRAQFVDVENDGDLDIYLCNSGGTTRFNATGGVQKLYLNNGSGVFTNAAGNIPAGNVIQPMDCIFGDIDGDYDLDVRIAGRGTNTSRLWRNNGLGVFTNLAVAVTDATCYSYDFGDMDGDGDLDMLGINAGASSTELLLANNGTGTYSNASAQLTTNPTTDDNDSKWFDYDNDGDLDLIIAAISGQDRIYNNNGAGTYTNVVGQITATADTSLDVKVADLTGDGRLDVVTAQGESGSFVNRIYVNVTGPIDTIAPNVLRTEQAPAPAPGVGGPFVIRTEVFDSHTSDRGFHDKGVNLNYQMNAGPISQVPMAWSGNSLWRGVIPAQTSGGTLHYWVTATDFNNNLGTGVIRDVPINIPCVGDATGNNVVDIDDLVIVITNWGQAAQIINISVQDNAFVRGNLNARAGDTLKFNWVSGTHTATSGTACVADGKFDFPITSGTPTASYIIPRLFSGNLPFYCTPHCGAGMTGVAAVVPFPADATGDGVVNIDDLVSVITHWGTCP